MGSSTVAFFCFCVRHPNNAVATNKACNGLIIGNAPLSRVAENGDLGIPYLYSFHHHATLTRGQGSNARRFSDHQSSPSVACREAMYSLMVCQNEAAPCGAISASRLTSRLIPPRAARYEPTRQLQFAAPQ